MASKYSRALMDSLPRDTNIGADRQEEIAIMKTAMQAEADFLMQAGYLAARYAALRAEKDVLDEASSVVQLKLDAIAQMVIDQYEAEGLTLLRLDDGQKVSIEYQPGAKVEDREKFRLWCIANGLERSLALHPSTTLSMVKERLLAGEPEPDGIVVTSRTTVKRYKA